MKSLGERIEKYRLLKNITQADLADDAGIGERTLRRLEAGEGGTIDTLMRVLNALEIPEGLEDLVPDHTIRPIERIRQTKTERSRATTPRAKSTNPMRGKQGGRTQIRPEKHAQPRWGDGKK